MHDLGLTVQFRALAENALCIFPLASLINFLYKKWNALGYKLIALLINKPDSYFSVISSVSWVFCAATVSAYLVWKCYVALVE